MSRIVAFECVPAVIFVNERSKKCILQRSHKDFLMTVDEIFIARTATHSRQKMCQLPPE